MARRSRLVVLTSGWPSLSARAGLPAMLLAVIVGCTSADQPNGESGGTPSDASGELPTATGAGPTRSTHSTPSTPRSSEPSTSTPTTTAATGVEHPVRFDVANAVRTVRVLAGRIGPREATSHSYRTAAGYVERRLRSWSYDVRRQHLRVPAGTSWGVDVPAGRTWNVIATPPDFDPSQRFRIVGAHLDTVPQAPGAEDNASGVAMVLELARLAAAHEPRIPVVFVAFGAEEPRGEGDALHHFGSRAMVARFSPEWRGNVRAMVSLDRVGVGADGVVPVSSGGLETPSVRGALMRTASELGIRVDAQLNQSSDHWSFDKAGFRAARVGSTPYAEYHSAADAPRVVEEAQLQRVGRLMWAWLN
ncbi:MAG: M28 family metallopeptidase [Nocardioidaceae bacterium]